MLFCEQQKSNHHAVVIKELNGIVFMQHVCLHVRIQSSRKVKQIVWQKILPFKFSRNATYVHF